MRSMYKENLIKKIFIYLALLFGLAFAAFPIIWMIAMSVRSNLEIFSVPPSLVPKTFSLEAYKKVLSDPTKVKYFFNSYLVAGAVTLVTLTIAAFAAYGFSRFDFKFKKQLNMFIISTQTVPPITLMIPFFGMMVAFKLYDTYMALIITYLALTLPYAILMLTGFFNTLPKEMDEAVLVDGGSRMLALWKVLIPISLPGIVATGLYTFLLSWNEFLFALTLTKSSEIRTIPIGIQSLMGQHAFEWNEMMAISLMGSLPIMLLFLFFQKYFLAGMTAGSVKA